MHQILRLRNPDALSRRVVIVVACLALAVVVAFVVMLQGKHTPVGTPLVLGKGTPAATTYSLEKVTGSDAQSHGLGGRSSLDSHVGMLFAYDQATQRCMWMKDMHFNIDIVWLNRDHRVVSIVPNLAPSTYPQTYCADAQYVIELPAGAAAAHGLRIGQVAKF